MIWYVCGALTIAAEDCIVTANCKAVIDTIVIKMGGTFSIHDCSRNLKSARGSSSAGCCIMIRNETGTSKIDGREL
jgi:hypothetical protein